MFPRQTMRTLDDMFGLVCGEWDVSDHDQIVLGGNSSTVVAFSHTPSNHGLSPHSSLSDDDSVAAGSATTSRCV